MFSSHSPQKVLFNQLPNTIQLNILALLQTDNFTEAKKIYTQAIQKYINTDSTLKV